MGPLFIPIFKIPCLVTIKLGFIATSLIIQTLLFPHKMLAAEPLFNPSIKLWETSTDTEKVNYVAESFCNALIIRKRQYTDVRETIFWATKEINDKDLSCFRFLPIDEYGIIELGRVNWDLANNQPSSTTGNQDVFHTTISGIAHGTEGGWIMKSFYFTNSDGSSIASVTIHDHSDKGGLNIALLRQDREVEWFSIEINLPEFDSKWFEDMVNSLEVEPPFEIFYLGAPLTEKDSLLVRPANPF